MIAIGLVQVGILLVALLRAKVLAVMMGPEGVGLIGTLDQLVMTLVQAASLGMPIAAMKFMSAAASSGQDELQNSYAAFARIIVGLATLATLLGLGVINFAPGILDVFLDQRNVLVAAVISVPPTMLTIFIAQTLAAAQRPNAAIIYNFCFASGVALSALSGAWLGGLEGFYYGTAVAGVVVVLGGMNWLLRHLGLSILRSGVSIRQQMTLRPNVFSTAMTASVSLLSISLTMLLVRYVVLAELGEKPTGYLQAAIGLALSIGSVLGTINALKLAPSVNRIQPNAERFERAFDFANRVALLMAAGAVPLALFPGLALTVLYSAEFIPAAMALILCLIWQVVYQLRVTCLQLLVGTDRPLSGAFSVVVALFVAMIAIWLFIEELGLIAAPVALICSDIVAIVLMLSRLSATVGMPFPRAVVARFLATSFGILGAGLIFGPSANWPEFSEIVLKFVYAISVFLIVWITMPTNLSPVAALSWLRTRLSR